MITPERIAQAIKETAEGMLSGDPNYAAKCVTMNYGDPVRVFMEDGRSGLSVAYPDGNGGWIARQCDYPCLIPAKRTFKCWVRWYKSNTMKNEADFYTNIVSDIWPSGYEWLTDPIEVVTEEKVQS